MRFVTIRESEALIEKLAIYEMGNAENQSVLADCLCKFTVELFFEYSLLYTLTITSWFACFSLKNAY